MSKNNVVKLAGEVKSKLDFRRVFRDLFPQKYRAQGNCSCPAHEDERESFQIGERHGYCHAGCVPPGGNGRRWSVIDLEMLATGQDFETATRALAERYNIGRAPGAKNTGNIVASYPYVDEHCKLLFEVCRFEPKDFRQRRPDGNGGWSWKLGDTRRVLFRLPDVIEAERVWLVEGEKDANSLHELGLCGTTSPQGAGKWPSLVRDWTIEEPLRGKDVVIVPDCDAAGRKHADEIARSLRGVAASVKVLELPGLPGKGDVSDFIEQHGQDAREQLLALAEKAGEYKLPDAEDEAGTEEDKSAFNRLLAAFNSGGPQVFLDQHQNAWASIRIDGAWRNLRVGSTAFDRHLTRVFHESAGKAPGREARGQVADYLAATATENRELHNRFAQFEDSIFIDLGTPTWDAIRITPEGYGVVRPERPFFKRFRHQQALPHPEPGGSLQDLMPLLPVKDDDSRILLMAWIVTLPLARVQRPGIILYGQQGSGKSTVCEILRGLSDPARPSLLSLPRDHQELVQIGDHHSLVVLDNVRGLPDWVCDDLCRFVTGAGFTKRALYTDDEDFIFEFLRPFILNGINVAGTSPDLLDRSILIELSRFPENQRKDRGSLLADFEAMRPRLMGAIADTLSKAMRIVGSITVDRLPRLADWTIWACAVAEAMGIGQARFLEAYQRSIQTQHDEILESEPLCMVLTAFMADKRPFHEDTPAGLYRKLSNLAEGMEVENERRWPKGAHAFSRKLNELSHTLTASGLEVTRTSRRAEGGVHKVVRITHREKVPEIPTTAKQRQQVNNIEGLSVVGMLSLSEGTGNTDNIPTTDNALESQDCYGVVGVVGISGIPPTQGAAPCDDAGTTLDPKTICRPHVVPVNPLESLDGDSGDDGDDIFSHSAGPAPKVEPFLPECTTCHQADDEGCYGTGKFVNFGTPGYVCPLGHGARVHV